MLCLVEINVTGCHTHLILLCTNTKRPLSNTTPLTISDLTRSNTELGQSYSRNTMKNVFEKHIIDIYEVLGRHSSFCGELRRIAYAAHLNTCNTYLLMDIFDGMVRSLHTPCVWGVVVSWGGNVWSLLPAFRVAMEFH